MSPPIVSVLITVYNREKYLAAAVESVLAQTFSDFELIVVDDCSKDRSVEIVRRYEGDSRVKVHVNERNLGDYPNRNKAASLAQGEYLKYLDADDVLYPHCLEMMVEAMERFPEAGFGVSRSVPGIVSPALLSPADAYRGHFFGGGLLSEGPLTTIIRRSAFEAIGGFDTARHTGDSRCWLTLARKSPVAITVPGLVWWRRHDEQESIIERRSPEAIADVTGRRFRQVLEALDAPDYPLSESERQAVRSKAVHTYARGILGRLVRGQFRYAQALLRESGQRPLALAKALLPASESEARTSNSELRTSDFGLRTSPSAISSIRGQREVGIQPSAFSPQPSAPISQLPSPSTPILAPFSFPSASDFSFQLSAFSSSPSVSVLIPAYNAEAHLGEAIESVLAQRFTDWELIIVDDASTDRTSEVARKYAEGARIRFFRNERRLGKWANHNRCAEFAKGKYLKFLHADDLLYPHCLEHMTHFMGLFPEAVVLQSHEVNRYLSPKLQTPREVYQQEFFGLVTLRESPSGVLYLRNAWMAAGGYDPQCEFAPAKLHLTMARTMPSLLIYAGLAFYRRGSQQWRHSGPGALIASDEERAWLREAVSRPQCPLTDPEKHDALRNLEALAEGRHRPSLRLYGWDFWYPFYEAASQFQAGLYPVAQAPQRAQAAPR